MEDGTASGTSPDLESSLSPNVYHLVCSWQIEKDFEQHVTKIAPFAKVVHDKVMNKNRGVVKARLKHLFQWTTDSENGTMPINSGHLSALNNCNFGKISRKSLLPSDTDGPPTSLNLRNLLWHGFVKPGEIPERYAMFLLVLVGSLGQVLRDKDLDTRLNIVRPFADVSPQVSTLDAKFPDLNLLSEDVSCLFNELPIIQQESNIMWFKALENFQEERYSWSAALIIQLLESILRQVFAKSNGCPERVLTAESSTLFTTFDEILTGTLPDGSENKVRHVIGDGILEMLLDLLVYPNGPRFRDRLSHGELDFHSINPILVLILIHIIITLSDKLSDQEKFKKNVFYSKSGRLLCSYKSLFHPIPMLRDDYIRLCTTLDSWVGLPGPTNDELLANGLSNDTSGQFYDEVKNIFADKPMDSLAGEIIRFLEPFSDTHSHLNSCKKLKIETIFRARSELQLVTVLHQIVSQCAKVNENIQAISRRRFDQWEERQLRSRQRVNYLRFIVRIEYLMI
ncbi:putative endoplasmic reticulum membrane-associated RNA degradation protein isoform X3 [Apostichopus japonicus]|uniref:Putative endoplasmic reticulum membrane-associated RNA degradation protein isoform X3 n=1 Tax=Stichopus japonicus TaxID=307972 RepID=A0A2G8KWV4_STIJA|nr:putative endoplasmic reticulum membrane-associated RNA degradation protein isoform X3 [Apostichopus japonicus]